MPSTRNMLTAGVLFVSGLLLTTMACVSLFGVASTSAPTAVPPTVTVAPTETAIPLYQQVVLNAAPWAEQGQPFGYTISAETPLLVGSSDPRVEAFNAAMKAIVDNAVAAFKQNVSNIPLNPDSTASTFQQRFNLLSPRGDIYSLKFDIQTFYTGAAHPGDASQTATFDLATGRMLTLADLFAPNADYLTPISKYCIAQLGMRDIGFQGFELGATATLQNYRNWNITAGGLMITFDEYQVAPYAAGPQTVLIPYKELAQILRPDGPVGSYYR